jgi:uncharacterized protein
MAKVRLRGGQDLRDHQLWRVLTPIVFAILAWILGSFWIPAASERFYVLAPPLVLIVVLCRGRAGLFLLRKRRFDLPVLALGILAVCMLYSSYAPGSIGMSWANVARGLRSGETLIAAYFVFSMVLIILLARALLIHLCRRLLVRNSASLTQPVLADMLALVLLVAVAVPYSISAIFIHRFKVPIGYTPASWGRPYESVTFATADGECLHGWYVPAKQPSARLVLICHGIGGNSSAFLGYLKSVDVLRANVFFFDFRAHGASSGHTSTLGGREKFDVEAAVQLVRERWPAQSRELIGLGVSMGSSAMLRAAAEIEPPFSALIVDSGFTAATDLADNVLRQFPASVRPAMIRIGLPLASLEAGYDLNQVRPVDGVCRTRAPILVVHAQGDGLIPVEHAQRLFDAAAEPKKIWIGDFAIHGGVLLRAPADCFEFVEDVLRPKAALESRGDKRD